MHCEEPWYVGAQNDQRYLIAGKPPAPDNDYPVHGAERTVIAKVYLKDDTAERIAACVNACAGISTELLEAQSVSKLLQKEADHAAKLQRQRDEALELLTKLVKGDVGRSTLGKLADGQGTATDDGKAWLAAKSAITKK
jgi:hypothetical protein